MSTNSLSHDFINFMSEDDQKSSIDGRRLLNSSLPETGSSEAIQGLLSSQDPKREDHTRFRRDTPRQPKGIADLMGRFTIDRIEDSPSDDCEKDELLYRGPPIV